ncbi:MAG: hypothetical protein AAGE59_25230 [Cyanobacteria bacterium P01_F01_bin.86]
MKFSLLTCSGTHLKQPIEYHYWEGLMEFKFPKSQHKFIFLGSIAVIYIGLVVWLDFLQGPYLWDETHFWETSLTFSDRLMPNLNDLRDYQELSTPLPFIIFGALEYLFGQGIFAGRLLNLILSLVMVFMIGWPSPKKGGRAILCVIGLFLCPYYLLFSGHLYTEMMACFWGLIGISSYFRNRHILSSLAFILAIASRQYMLAFPMGIAAYEIFCALKLKANKLDRGKSSILKMLVFTVASLSILGWIVLFGGLAPVSSFDVRPAPNVQRSLLALTPNSGLYALSIIGLYFVIPELLLFWKDFSLRQVLQQRRKKHLYLVICSILLVLFIIFPPSLLARGPLIKLAAFMSTDFLKLGLFYCLAALTCVRFAKLNLGTWLLLFHSLIMMKAFPWDKYALPLLVVLWFLKSIDFLDPEVSAMPALQAVGETQVPIPVHGQADGLRPEPSRTVERGSVEVEA